MNFKLEEIEIKNLDHLGIVAGIIDEIGIVEKVNELLGTDDRENINCGEMDNMRTETSRKHQSKNWK
jgi:hypothetical protein